MSIVSLTTCANYEESSVIKATEEMIEHMGGLSKYFTPGDKVLLKVNLLMKKSPEEATTTHPMVVKVFAEQLRNYGCHVIIGDSPGGPFDLKSLQGIYKACGYTDILSENIVLNENVNVTEVSHTDGKLLKKMTLIEVLRDVDQVVSFSKLKTHGMMKFTGAVKNMFGIVPGLIKAEYHFKMPKTDDFADMLVDLCEYAKPVLSIMDGIVAMEGAGPSAGTPRPIGVLLASDNPHALDVAAVGLVGIDPETVPTLLAAKNRGLVDFDLKGISVVGDPAEKFIQKDFDAPEIRSVDLLEGILPGFLRKGVEKLVKPKPIINMAACIGCGECARLCPPQTIEMKGRQPVIHLKNCIRCYCCQELCPKKAVDIHRPLLLRIMTKL